MRLHWFLEASRWLSLPHLPFSATRNEMNWCYPLYGSVRSRIPWTLFSVSCFCECLSASVMQILKILTSPWQQSAELYTTLLQSPLEEICRHPCSFLPVPCVCLRKCECGCVRKRGERRFERGRDDKLVFFLLPSNMTTNPTAFCSTPCFWSPVCKSSICLYSDCVQQPAIVYICHMLWLTAGMTFMSPYNPSPLSLQHDWKAPWPRCTPKNFTFHCKHKQTVWCIVN